MIIKSEDDILDMSLRKKILQDIESQENRQRKAEAYKRYVCYKDKTSAYVVSYLLKQFDKNTVEEMRYCLSNLGISRKVIDKLARVYKYGVERKLFVEGSEIDDALIKEIEKELSINRVMKKANRFFKLFKNTALYIRPKPIDDETQEIRLTALPPYLYDVVETSGDREKPLAFILSNYDPKSSGTLSGATGLAVVPGTDGRNGQVVPMISSGDGIDQTIADSLEDQDQGLFTWWTDSFHFVTDAQGVIVPGHENGLNPIGVLPFVNYAEDQDGAFWATGGDDLTDGAILINSMITNINHCGITQGYGQLVLTGKDLPKVIKVGPNKAIRLTHEGEDPVPTFKFESANPPLDQLRALVEMYVALLLTTNNLSTSGVSSQLNGGGSFPSGIAMMIDKAESMEDVEDQRQVFEDNEPRVWHVIAKWHTLLKSRGELSEKASMIDFPAEFDVMTAFNEPKAIESEKERLDVIEKKLSIGLMTMLDAIKQENPQLNDEQAEQKLKDILEEKMAKAAMAVGSEGNGHEDNGISNNSDDRAGRQPAGRGEGGGRGLPPGASPAESEPEEKPSNR